MTYIVRRLLQTVITLFLLSVLFFLLVRLQPYNPCASGTLGCTELLHFDEPLSTQYISWMGAILHGDFGISTDGDPIGTLLVQKLPPTAELVLISLLLQQMIALPLGILSAYKPYSVTDSVLTVVSYVALSLPAFALGYFLISLFSVQWNMLPVAGYENSEYPLLWTHDWFSAFVANPGLILGDLARHLVMPVFTLTLTGIAVDSRFMRASMLQVMHQDFMRTARAKGLPRRSIIFKHAFRNALLPIITNFGLYLPALIGGVVVVESVFTWGGIGYIFAQAVSGGRTGYFDTPLIQTLVMLSTLAVVLANLLADLAYAVLDPRIRYGGDSGI